MEIDFNKEYSIRFSHIEVDKMKRGEFDTDEIKHVFISYNHKTCICLFKHEKKK